MSDIYTALEVFRQEPLPPEWNRMAFSKLTKLTQLLKNVDLIDGRLVDIDGGSITIDDRVEHRMLTFKSLARIFIGAPLVQKALQNNVADCQEVESITHLCVSVHLVKGSPVGGFPNISAQQRQSVRVKISPRVA
ncbi:hypothetical protein ACFXTI_016918 [Malus domestica]